MLLYNKSTNMPKLIKFIIEAKIKHNNTYDYSNVNCAHSQKNNIIIRKIHDKFIIRYF